MVVTILSTRHCSYTTKKALILHFHIRTLAVERYQVISTACASGKHLTELFNIISLY